jgi:hypothetical protein
MKYAAAAEADAIDPAPGNPHASSMSNETHPV